MENMHFCQSCAMPMSADEMKGTNTDGTLNQDFCVYCYKNGSYTQECTMDEMIEFCVKPICEHNGMSEDEARAQMRKFFPTLKRWS